MYTSNGNTFIIDPIFLQQLEPLPPPSSLFSSSHHILPPPPSSSFSSTLMFPSNNDHDHSSNNDKKKKKKEERGERCVWKKNNSTSTSSGTTGTGTGGGGGGGGGGNTKHKTDRHSKIRTAKGLRDRRMRLSLDVARRFFGLQDMLGFDKASKTVEWLLSQAKSQIHNLEMTLHYNSGWSTSSTTSSTTSTTTTATMNCSSLSGLDDVAADPSSTTARRVKVSRRARVQRESRAKARERARERTREKMMMRRRKLITTITSAADDDGSDDNGGGGGRSKQIPQNINIVKNNMNPPPSSNCFDVGEILESESDQQARDDQKNLWSVLLEDDDVVPMINKWSWSPSMYFNSLHTSGLLIHEQFSSESFQSMGGLLYDI